MQPDDTLDFPSHGSDRIDASGTGDRFETDPMIGRVVGGFRILECVGQGAFGSVYLADQSAPVRRRVAVKIIKPGLDSEAVLTRFDIERRVLAMMDHPSIASVVDAGQSEDGRPYFVMEYVQGAPITSHCDANRLTVHERLALFREVCRAIQHAHQRGIIHRDIKPSNVLVTRRDDQPQPKVIDFGIAKATTPMLDDDGAYTGVHQLLGTPVYMSPEQAGGSVHTLDTRADVYSLGAMLFEILVGTPPLLTERLKSLSLAELNELLRTERRERLLERLRDSDDIEQIAARRSTTPAQLVQLLRGDLTWITEMCLQPEPGQRYPSVAALEEDIRRHIAHEAVDAGPPSKLYRLRKFARRRRVEVLAGGVVGVVFFVGFAATAMAWVRANEESERLRSTLDFFSSTLAGTTARASPLGIWEDAPALTLGEALEPAENLLEGTFESEPGLESTIRQLVGLGQLRGGRFDEAIVQLDSAHRLRSEAYGADDSATLELLLPIADARSKAGDVEGAFESARHAYSRYADVFGQDSPETRAVALWIARWLSSAFRFSEADDYYRRAMLLPGSDTTQIDAVTLAARVDIVGSLISAGRLDEAEATLRTASVRIKQVDDTVAAKIERQLVQRLGLVLVYRGRPQEAIEVLRSEAGSTRELGPVRARLLAWAYGHADDTEASHRLFDTLLSAEQVNPGPPYREIFARLFYADVLLREGRAAEAAEQAEEALQTYDSFGFPNDPDRLWGHALLAEAYVSSKAYEEAARSIEEALTI
ncbi:MAG: protein kinase, partial [Planctomycetota bacterium]